MSAFSLSTLVENPVDLTCMYFTNVLILVKMFMLSKFYVICFIVDDIYTVLICICMYFNGKRFLP